MFLAFLKLFYYIFSQHISTSTYLYVYVDGLEGVNLKCPHPRQRNMYGPFSDGCILIAFLNVSPRFERFSNSFYYSFFFLQRFVDRCAVWRHCGGCRVAAAEVGSRSHHQRDDDIAEPRGSAARPPVSRSALQALSVRRLLSDSAPRVGGRLCRQLRTGPA